MESLNNVSPAQIRAARALLGISGSKLAREAGVGEATLGRLERGGEARKGTEVAVRMTLEEMGVEFVEKDGKKGAVAPETAPSRRKIHDVLLGGLASPIAGLALLIAGLALLIGMAGFMAGAVTVANEAAEMSHLSNADFVACNEAFSKTRDEIAAMPKNMSPASFTEDGFKQIQKIAMNAKMEETKARITDVNMGMSACGRDTNGHYVESQGSMTVFSGSGHEQVFAVGFRTYFTEEREEVLIDSIMMTR